MASQSTTVQVQDKDTGEWKSLNNVSVVNDSSSASLLRGGANSTGSSFKELPRAAVSLLETNAHVKDCWSLIDSSNDDNAVNTNLLILLHGTGDNHTNFASFGTKLELPQTAVLSIGASSALGQPLPFNLGYTWFVEMDYYNTGKPLSKTNQVRLKSLHRAALQLNQFLDAIVNHSTLPAQHIFLLGYGSGATLCSQACAIRNGNSLGGCIAIQGGAPNYKTTAEKKERTPLLLLTGATSTLLSVPDAKRYQRLYSKQCDDKNKTTVSYLHVQAGKGNEMVSSRSEVRVILEFLSPRLSIV